VRALNQSLSLQTSPIAAVEGLPRMTQRHEQPVADGQLNVKAEYAPAKCCDRRCGSCAQIA
jgi:hypothetical protein